MTRTLDILTFGVPLLVVLALSIITMHPLMWAVTGVWAVIAGLLFYWRSRK